MWQSDRGLEPTHARLPNHVTGLLTLHVICYFTVWVGRVWLFLFKPTLLNHNLRQINHKRSILDDGKASQIVQHQVPELRQLH